MRIATLATITLLAFAQAAGAADGVKVRFKVEQQTPLKSGATDTRTYENAFLFAFGEKAVADFDGITKIAFQAMDKGDGTQLHVALSMYQAGTASFVGEGDVVTKFGDTADIQWSKDGSVYVLHLAPSKAPLPVTAAAAPAAAPAVGAIPAAAIAGQVALTPVTTTKIQMPDDACRQRLSGWVTLEFAVMPDGKVADAHVTNSEPKGVFDAAAVAAVSGRSYPPQAKPLKMHEHMPVTFADCRVEQLQAVAVAAATGAPVSQDDCPAIAQQAQALGEPMSADEAGRGLLEGTPAQIYSAPSEHCLVAGKKLKVAGQLLSHLEYQGYSLVSRPKDPLETAVWVRSNALKDTQ